MNKLFGLFLLAVAFLAPVSTGQATLVSLSAPILYPNIIGAMSGGPTLGTAATIDASGEYASYVFVARENMVVSHVSFRAGTATTAQVVVTIEGVDTSGLPDGTPSFGSSASAATAVTTGTNPIIALGASATIAKGAIFAVKVAWSAGSLVVQNFNTGNPGVPSLPYSVVNTGSPTKGVSQSTFALGSSATTFYQTPGTTPASGATNTSNFNNTSSAKRGLKFTLPFNCRIIGVRFYSTTSIGDYNAGIYDGTGAGVGSTVTAFDGDKNANNGNGTTFVYFSTALTYTAGSTYYAAIEPTSATNVSLGFFSMASADFLTAFPSGTNAVYSAFTNPGTPTWTDTNTQLPYLDIIIDQIDNGAGSGGGGGRIIGG